MAIYQFPSIRRTCCHCGDNLARHPAWHTLCRRCFGYHRLAQQLPRLLADIRAVRP